MVVFGEMKKCILLNPFSLYYITLDLLSVWQASKGGNPLTNNFGTLLGDANGQRTFFTIEKMGFN